MVEKKDLISRQEKILSRLLESCELCPRKCRVNRLLGEKGFCGTGSELLISSYGPHFGEEPEITGTRGSGTIFFAGCNLLCLYCQNCDISHIHAGTFMSANELADSMIRLQYHGCHNINLVTPSHVAPQIVQSLKKAFNKGLAIPIIWNCSGYENVETLKHLEGIIDIYMPDIKYSDPVMATKFSSAPDYFDRCKESLQEMFRQVGDLETDAKGIATKGLLVRHLVLPNNTAGSEQSLQFIADLSIHTYVNIMAQYTPHGKAKNHKEINRPVTLQEVQSVKNFAKKVGLYRGF